MMTRLPKAAAGILDEGVLCYVAVSTDHGPHLTPMVYAVHAGRLWVTTSRSSVKARAWRASPGVAGMVRHGDRAVIFRGKVSTYDALDPLSWPGAVATAPRLAAAGTKFSLKNARFFAGYAVDARRIPLSWTPPGRVFASIRLTAGRVLEVKRGTVGPGWGEWPTGVSYRREFRTRPASTGRWAPATVRAKVGTGGVGAMALEGSERALTVLPATWRRVDPEGVFDAVVSASYLDLSNADRDAAAALTADRASTWRASDMTGLLVQGRAELYSPSATTRGRRALAERIDGEGRDGIMALVRLRPDRAVWWRGWTSGTVTAMSGAAS